MRSHNELESRAYRSTIFSTPSSRFWMRFTSAVCKRWSPLCRRHPPAADWREMMLLYVDGVRDFYLSNRVEMILALMPVSLLSVNQVSAGFRAVIIPLLHAQGLVPKTQKVLRACEMVSELADLVWRKSLIEKGTLTPAYTERPSEW